MGAHFKTSACLSINREKFVTSETSVLLCNQLLIIDSIFCDLNFIYILKVIKEY